jgi:hypothetical protein
VRVRKHLGAILIGLGVFLLVLGALSRFYAYPTLSVVPLDKFSALPSDDEPDPPDPPMVGRATDATIFSLAAGLKEITTDITSVRNTIGQVADSEDLIDATGKELVIYETFSFNTDSKDRILSGTFDRVIFDRHSGAVYHCSEDLAALCDEKTGSVKVDPEETDVEGTVDDIAFVYPGEGDNFENGFEGQYFKMPFNTQKQDYDWWDGDLGHATPAEYDGEDTMQGLKVYRFVQTIPDTKIGEQEIPASIAGVDEDGDITVDVMYSNIRTLWIEPETGVLIKGQEDQHNYFSYNGEEVITTTDGVIAYDDATVTSNVDTFKPLALELKLVRIWIPLLGLVLGLVLIALGTVMVIRRHRSESIETG